jgi:hypothetical protein
VDLFNSICQALGFGLAVGIFCGVVLPARLCLPFAAVLGTIVAGIWLRSEDVIFWPMLPIGLFVMLTGGVIGDVFAGASRRESLQSTRPDQQGRSPTLVTVGVLLAALVAILAYLVPPTAIVWSIAIILLFLRRRRGRPEKHEGLRILR